MFQKPEVDITGFDYMTASELDRLRRCLSMLYGTPEGSCPGDRAFGLDMDFLDCPADVARNRLALEVVEKTRRYEPRAEVLKIEYVQAPDGALRPRITIGEAWKEWTA